MPLRGNQHIEFVPPHHTIERYKIYAPECNGFGQNKILRPNTDKLLYESEKSIWMHIYIEDIFRSRFPEVFSPLFRRYKKGYPRPYLCRGLPSAYCRTQTCGLRLFICTGHSRSMDACAYYGYINHNAGEKCAHYIKKLYLLNYADILQK